MHRSCGVRGFNNGGGRAAWAEADPQCRDEERGLQLEEVGYACLLDDIDRLKRWGRIKNLGGHEDTKKTNPNHVDQFIKSKSLDIIWSAGGLLCGVICCCCC